MSEQTRETLKNYFETGRKPSRQNFADLIDSNLNMIDEGIRKTPEHGLVISQLGQGRLLTLDKKETETCTWNIRMDDKDALLIGTDNAKPILRLTAEGSIQINEGAVALTRSTEKNHTDLSVRGSICCSTRKGNFKSPNEIDIPVLADGKWHDLIKNIRGCNSFEIMAGARNPGNKKNALLHAFAMNADNPESIFNKYFKKSNVFLDFFRLKKKIVTHHAYYNQKCDKIRLRWITPDPSRPEYYSLQIKTNCCYGDNTRIRYHITRLWEDAFFDKDDSSRTGESG